MTDKDFFWLVGILEGEGCFLRARVYPSDVRIYLGSTDRDVVERCCTLLGSSKVWKDKKPAKDHYKQSYRCAVSGVRGAAWMVALLPHMSERRQEQIVRALRTYRPSKSRRGLRRAIELEQWIRAELL